MGILAIVLVTVLLDGQPIESLEPARLVRGTIVAPIDPYVRAVADGIEVDGAHGEIRFIRGTHDVRVTPGTCRARVDNAVEWLPIAPYLRDGRVIIPLAALARALGDRTTYESAYRVLSIFSPAAPPVATPAPYLPPRSPIAPGPTFEPTDEPAPQVTVRGIPQPRRTPIPITDSP